jgi:hypothetical protein
VVTKPDGTSTGDGSPWESIGKLAQRAHRWIVFETVLFETLGSWARDAPEVAVRRPLAVWCHRHAWHAELWRDRLPEIDGLELPDDGETAAEGDVLRRRLADASKTATRLATLVEGVLAEAAAELADQLDATEASLDGPTARVMTLVARDLTAEIVELNAVRAAL